MSHNLAKAVQGVIKRVLQESSFGASLPLLVNLGRVLANFGQHMDHIHQLWSKLVRIWPKSAKVTQEMPQNGRIWGVVGATLGTSELAEIAQIIVRDTLRSTFQQHSGNLTLYAVLGHPQGPPGSGVPSCSGNVKLSAPAHHYWQMCRHILVSTSDSITRTPKTLNSCKDVWKASRTPRTRADTVTNDTHKVRADVHVHTYVYDLSTPEMPHMSFSLFKLVHDISHMFDLGWLTHRLIKWSRLPPF